MPYKNRTKIFKQGAYYHLYGRGIEKMLVFKSPSDYRKFKLILNKYLNPNFREKRIINNSIHYIFPNSVHDQIKVICYCLMPNHFHLICENSKKFGISELMRRILPVYTKYFNKKYQRQGQLIQGGYRSVLIKSQKQLITTARYIHLNPVKDRITKKASDYKQSSCKNYLNKRHPVWLHLHKDIFELSDFPNLEAYLGDEGKVGLTL